MKRILIAIILMGAAMPAVMAQKSVSSGISRRSTTTDTRRGPKDSRATQTAGNAETRMTDPAWMKVVYRSLDLNDAANAVLYYPEEADAPTDSRQQPPGLRVSRRT